MAAYSGHLDIVGYLAPYVDDEESIRTAINYAKDSNQSNIVKILRETHPSLVLTPTYDDLSELLDAAQTGNLAKIIQITQALTDINPVVDVTYGTVLHNAAYFGQLNVVKYYTDQFEDKNPKAGVFKDKGTPLDYAASAGHFNVVEYLTPFAEDDEEIIHSAIESAKIKGHTGIVDFLNKLNLSLGRTATYPEDEVTTIKSF